MTRLLTLTVAVAMAALTPASVTWADDVQGKVKSVDPERDEGDTRGWDAAHHPGQRGPPGQGSQAWRGREGDLRGQG